MDFARVALTVADFLQSRHHRVGLAGALALHAYGASRTTFDLDLVVERESQAALVPFLESLGYETLYRSSGYSNHLHPDTAWGRLDVIYVDENTAEKLIGQGATSVRLGARDFRVPRPEHLAAMKVQAMKNDPSRTLQDMADIQFLLRLSGVDLEEVRGYFERAGLVNEYEQIRRSL